MTNSDLFFAISAAGFVIFFALFVIILVYLIRILRDVKEVSSVAKDEVKNLAEDIRKIREEVEREGAGVRGVFSFISSFFKSRKVERNKNKSSNGKK